MNPKELIYIKTIADERSLSKAAQKLYISQPSLSQAVKKIEETLSTPLFKRTSNGLLLTTAGEKYYSFATQTLKMYDDFLIEISYLNDLKKGQINIGITNHLGASLLPVVIPQFKALCPYINIAIIEKNSTSLEKSLLNGEIDFAIMHAPQTQNSMQLHYHSLGIDKFLLAMHPQNQLLSFAKELPNNDYPILDINLCADAAFILLDKEQRIRQISDSILSKASFTPKIVLTLKNFETARRLCAQGIGVAFVPQLYTTIYKYDVPLEYVQIEEKYDPYWIMCIATVKNRFLSKADKAFLKLTTNYLDDKNSSIF